ncbi:hypothetical protein F4821DRAFT_265341 [Hypoxylon rubiginosum]|uniref:Uncharacterized protein n=1 Tax=Hypoxylon rubiginosum TaxID=110542 RepID=A0ACC0CL11_9PEZI|nr:hypothetical protein F4821DRAFT_265341 [Hypoxylon rubiginosum]
MALVESSWHAARFLAPLHILSFSTLLGTELYQSFVVVKVTHQALPRSAFTTLQKRIFPIYFRIQTFLVFLTAATIPPYGPLTLRDSKGNWVPFAVAGVTALLNLAIYGPRTRKVMVDRIHQETRDGRKPDDTAELSEDMTRLNKAFSRTHAMSIHLNLISIGAMIWWGWKLASRLDVKP